MNSTSQSKEPALSAAPVATWKRPGWATVVGALFLVAIFTYFFGYIKIFLNGHVLTWLWAWQSWGPEGDYEHAKLIPLIAGFLIWHQRHKLRAAPIGTSAWGWLFIGIGIFFFVASARTLQGRLGIIALPFLFYGAVLYLWGWAVARILLFPIAFLFFMVPLNFLTQATTKLQFVETATASLICNLIGIKVYAIGTTINASNEAFHFTIDEGCSGIRSLMAIAMLSAIYGHFTQDRLWKKIAIFAAALVFAVIGNAGRLVSIMVVARFFGQDLAGGPYHGVSGYLSFPFAIGAMVLFGKLLNIRRGHLESAASATSSVSI